MIPYLRIKNLKNHALPHGKFLYSLPMGVTPTPHPPTQPCRGGGKVWGVVWLYGATFYTMLVALLRWLASVKCKVQTIRVTIQDAVLNAIVSRIG